MKKLSLVLVALVLLSMPAFAQFTFQEDFDYAAGDTLGSHGWLITSTPSYTNPLTVVAPGLTFSGYSPSTVGNACAITNTGQDRYKEFNTTITSGDVYLWAMINVSAANATGDYFLAMSPTTQTNMTSRLYAKSSGSGYVLGLNKSNETPVTYGSTVFDFNTTYVIVSKYSFQAGTGDDILSLYVLPSGTLPIDEPATPEMGPYTNSSKGDAVELKSVTLRQGTAANAPTLTIDGIRVTTAWDISDLPVQIASFAAIRVSDDVQLNWNTLSETNNFGFYVERKLDGTASFTEVPNSFVAGHQTTLEPQAYSFTDNTVTSGVWYYRLRQVDLDGKISYSEPVKVEFTTDVATGTPASYTLSQNFPNPFNPSTDIQFTLAKAGTVSLKVYDMLGREVATLANGEYAAGVHHVMFNATNLPSGAYFYSLKAGNFSAMKSMLLVK